MARGAERTGDRVSGVATSGAIVPDLGGGLFVVSGLARFRPSTSPQRLEPECIGPAGAEDVARWGAVPLRRRQGPRSRMEALFGPLTDVESGDAIIEGLDALS